MTWIRSLAFAFLTMLRNLPARLATCGPADVENPGLVDPAGGDDDGDGKETPAEKDPKGKKKPKGKGDGAGGGDGKDDEPAEPAPSGIFGGTAEEEEGDDDEEDHDEEEEEEEDGDDEEGDDDEEDGEEEEDEEDDEGVPAGDAEAQALRARWESKLARGPKAAAPRLNIDGIAVRPAALARFNEVMSHKDADNEEDPVARARVQAEGVAVIATDIAAQMANQFYLDVHSPHADRMEKSVRNITIGRKIVELKKQAGEAWTPKIEKRVSKLYNAFREEHGWDGADRVPLDKLFRMAGGKFPPKGGKPTEERAKARQRAEKEAALKAGARPRTLAPSSEGGERRGKTERARGESRGYAPVQRPFFSIG